MKEYLFGWIEDDFDSDIHVVTGLIDVFEHPILRMSVETKKHPIGFGREEEWNEFERTGLTSSDSRQSVGEGQTGGFRKFKAGNASLSQI